MRLFGIVLVACAACAQSRLVTVNFSAVDAQGHAITDLTAAEVQVTDQGKPAPLVAFRNEALRSAVVGREYSNRPAPAVSRIQVILFDVLNLSLSNRQQAIDQTVRALEKLESSDSLYFYLLNLKGDLSAVRALPETAPDPKPAATPWTRNIRSLLEQAVGPVAAVQPAIQRDVMLRVQRTYAAMEILAGRMAALPGRKSVLWMTFGTPCALPLENGQRWDCRPTLAKVAAKLDEANVAVDPITLQTGLVDVENNVTLQEFVDRTGGRLLASGDIERSLPESAQMARSSYRLQYAPAGNWDGKEHKVRVSSVRAGVTLLAKQSYPAAKTVEAARGVDPFQSPFDASEIALSVAATPGAQPHTLHLRIGIDTQDLLIVPEKDRFTADLVVSVTAYLPDNRLQNYPPLPVHLNLTAEQKDKIARDGMHLGQDVTIPEGVKKIRLLVTDKAANTAGTVTIAVE